MSLQKLDERPRPTPIAGTGYPDFQPATTNPVNDTTALLAAVGLLLVNACFVAAEFAIVTVRRSRVETLVRNGRRRAVVLEKVLNDLDRHITAGQLVITAASLAIGAIAEPALARSLEQLLAPAGLASPAFVHLLALLLAFTFITVTLVIAGELAPKFLGLRRTEKVAMWMSPPLHLVARLSSPLLAVMNRLAQGLLSMVGVTEVDQEYESMSAEELQIFLAETSTLGRLSISNRRLLGNLIEYSDHNARQVMIARDQIDFISLERSLEENMTIIHETSHTRYPLCETGLDSVVGMIHIKDLFHRANSLQSSEDLRRLQHEMQFVPETQAIDVLQRNFQRRRAHMALVVDEYGVPTGLVTLEDVLEELVGEIQDEFDADEEAKILHTDDGILIDGMLLVEDLCRELDIEDTGGDSDTVGGYVTDQLGRIARAGDVFEIGDYHGRVSEMQGRRIARVLLAPAAGQEPAGGENPAAEDSPASDDPT